MPPDNACAPRGGGEAGATRAKRLDERSGDRAISGVDGHPVGHTLSGAGDRPVGHERLTEIQRRRMIQAMIEVAAECGAANVTVARVVARSGVSRRTFYELFKDAEECLLAAMEESLDCARRYVLETHDPSRAWRVRVRVALQALLGFLEDEPARARLLVIETLGAGAEVLERRARVLAELIRAIDAGRRESEKASALTPLSAEGALGAVLAVVHTRLVKDARPALYELTNPLTSMIVLPYLGPAAARKELAMPLPKRPRPRSAGADGAGNLGELPIRITYRTICVLSAIAAQPGASNRGIGTSAGIADQGQISKLLRRLEKLGLIVNQSAGKARGTPNTWTLTPKGAEAERAMGRARYGT